MMEHVGEIEKRLWSVADHLRANSNFASNEYFLPVTRDLFRQSIYDCLILKMTGDRLGNGFFKGDSWQAPSRCVGPTRDKSVGEIVALPLSMARRRSDALIRSLGRMYCGNCSNHSPSINLKVHKGSRPKSP